MLRFKPNQTTLYWLYTYSTDDNTVVYWGVSYLNKILDMSGLLGLDSFDIDSSYTLNILGAYQHEHEAINHASRMFKTLPVLNVEYVRKRAKGNMIQCIETGLIYKTQADACKILGISQSNLSNHLARRKGFKSVKGMRFFHVATNDANLNLKEFNACCT